MPKTKATTQRSKSAHPKPKSNTPSKSKSKSPGREGLRSKSKSPSKVSKGKASKKDTASVGAIAFSSGAYIAFVDPDSEDTSKFKIGLLISDVKEKDQQAMCEAFTLDPKQPLQYKLHGDKHELAEHTIISEIKVTVLKTKGKKKEPTLIKISKQESNKIQKLVPNVLRGLEAVMSEPDEDQDEGESSDEQIQEQPAPQKKILRIKGVKSAKPKADANIEDENSILQPRSESKKKVKAKTQKEAKKASKVPEIGQKRARKQVEEQHESDEEDDEQEEATTSKRRKVGSAKSKQIESASQPVKAKKAKAPPKRPTVYKKGVWNPDIELITEEKNKFDQSNNYQKYCCVLCNNRNIMRAAWTGNKQLLSKCVQDIDNISNCLQTWGPETKANAYYILLQKGDPELLQTLMKPKVSKTANQSEAEARSALFNHRKNPPPFLLSLVQQGTVSHMAYGGHIRQVGMTRGNRQGNNAFLNQGSHHNNNSLKDPVHLENNMTMLYSRQNSLPVETFKTLEKFTTHPDLKQNMFYNLMLIIRAGDSKLAAYLIKSFWQQSNYNLNELHYLALETSKKVSERIKEFKSVSVAKKCQGNCNITPLHVACINPDSDVLRMFLEVNPDFNMTDTNMRRPIHYAAANAKTGALKLLLERGANLADVDTQKTTPLHVAASARRSENVKLILENNPSLIKLRDRQGRTPMAIACENSDLETIKVLHEKGVTLGTAQGPQRMQPLAWAAAQGDYEICEWLLDRKARVVSADKFKRTPLILAVRNGHLRVASLLLQRGADWDQADSSGNTPLHYAAAYGWSECIDLLLKAGASINAENSWRVTPINAAMLLNHEGCVKQFLGYPEIDVNCVDEAGRTLLTLALLDLTERTVDFVKYLIQKGADPNKADVDGKAALHYLANLNPLTHGLNQWTYGHTNEARLKFEAEKRKIIETRRRVQLELADLLLSSGAQLSLADSQKRTPFAICLEKDNVPLLEKLVAEISVDSDPTLLHSLANKILNKKYQDVLHSILKNKPPKKDSMNSLDEQGLTPFLAYIEYFCSKYSSLRQEIVDFVAEQAQQHKRNFKHDKVDVNKFFAPKEPQNPYYGGFGGFGGYGRAARKGGFNDVDLSDVADQGQVKLAQDKIMNTIIKQFVETLRLLTTFQADPKARVGKLLSARKREEKRRQEMLNPDEAGLEKADQGNLIDVQKANKEEILLKKREEVLKERSTRPRKEKERKKNQQIDSKSKKKSKKVEEPEYHKTLGHQNAFHLVISCPHPDLINLLFELNVDPDLNDIKGKTPLNLCSTTEDPFAGLYLGQKNIITRLLASKVRIDEPDMDGRTPFLNFFERSKIDKAREFLKLGARPNQIDKAGFYALKYAMIRRDNDLITELVKVYGADVNLLDNKGRNLLHHAVNLSSATADASFETEQLLLDLGVSLNHRDHHQRTPLHYAFVKIGKWSSTESVDPIETVSSLCGFKDLEINVPDRWMKTPLHYASQRGASICAVYLGKRGADLEAIDIYGNSPLGVALLSGHYSYGILLIQRHADVQKMVHPVDPEKIKKMWKEQEKKSKAIDEEMSESDDDSQKKHRELFDKKKNHDLRNQFMQGSSDYDDEDDSYGEESDDSDAQFENNVFNNQNAFGGAFNYGKKAVKKTPARAAPAGMFGGFGMAGGIVPGGVFGAQPAAQNQVEQPKSLQKEPESMFRKAVTAGQLGLAYLIMDEGYSLMLAVQDAMDVKKFQLVLTLLAKTADDGIVQQKNAKGQTLLHVLSQNASQCMVQTLTRIYQQLIQRGVDAKAKDHAKRTALHYAVESSSETLVKHLLQDGLNARDFDSKGFCPISIYLSGKAPLTKTLFNPAHPNPQFQYDPIFEALAKAGADMNIEYPEVQFKPVYGSEPVYKTRLGINFVRRLAQAGGATGAATQRQLLNSLQGLTNFGYKFSLVDSDGRDMLAHAILANNVKLVEFLIGTDARDLNIGLKDLGGKSAVHLVVNPCEYGSYENVQILQALADVGYPLNLSDSDNKTPSHYAKEQKSGSLIESLSILLGDPGLRNQPVRNLSGIALSDWPKAPVDPDADAAAALKKAEEKEREEMEKSGEAGKQKELVPVDSVGGFSKSHKVYCEGLKPWDVYLTKVDLKNGIYGDYVFYKMQLLHDSVRDLYIVFTRYGRIGEDGMHQRTPFTKIEEAQKDFNTIFKSKTGNDFQDLDKFSRVKKKYALAKVAYVTVKHQDYLAPFDFDKCPKSNLKKHERQLIEEVANVTMYQRAMKDLGVDINAMPVSCLTKDAIQKAKDILGQIREKVEEDNELSKQGFRVDLEKLTAVREATAELSSRYYELIPQSQYKNQIAPPLNNLNRIKTSFDNLQQLSNIEHANKILLGALYNQTKLHPADYVHQALNLDIQHLDPSSPEFKLIEKQVRNTHDGCIDFERRKIKLFRVQRKGEAEAIQPFLKNGNRRLLYHGSSLVNYLGILSQGLRIAPPEAPTTGYLLGKGVYFADMFSKSYGYAVQGNKESQLLLLCEVALGNMKEMRVPEYVEELDRGYHSVRGFGKRGPDYDHSIILPNGVEVPAGPLVNYEEDLSVGAVTSLQHNEFVVYNTDQIRMRYLIQVVDKTKEEMQKQAS